MAFLDSATQVIVSVWENSLIHFIQLCDRDLVNVVNSQRQHRSVSLLTSPRHIRDTATAHYFE